VAGHLGMTLREYLLRVPPQEHEVWVAHLAARWDHPGPVEWYLMQVAAEVRRWMARSPEAVKVDEMKLKFKPVERVRRRPRRQAPPQDRVAPPPGPAAAQTPEQVALEVKMAKTRLFVALGSPDGLREDLLRGTPGPAQPGGG
jgi:hypothetical protein